MLTFFYFTAKPCPAIVPLKDGSVELPCVEKFNSSCVMKCNRNYYLKGDRLAKCIVRDGITKWEKGKASCISKLFYFIHPHLH